MGKTVNILKVQWKRRTVGGHHFIVTTEKPPREVVGYLGRNLVDHLIKAHNNLCGFQHRPDTSNLYYTYEDDYGVGN